MDFEVLPGPSLAELARTALASAAVAEVDDARSPGNPVYPGLGPAQVPVRDGRDGSPLLLPVTGSVLEHQLAASDLGSVELIGTAGVRVRVPLADYRAAAPDPLRREAPAVLRHLEQGHMADLIACVRVHGLAQADWVLARGLDRHGLELLVLAADGVAAVRLGFPDGPVTSLQEVPASIRAALTCRCESARHRR